MNKPADFRRKIGDVCVCDLSHAAWDTQSDCLLGKKDQNRNRCRWATSDGICERKEESNENSTAQQTPLPALRKRTHVRQDQ